jgi:hypothetical protein
MMTKYEISFQAYNIVNHECATVPAVLEQVLAEQHSIVCSNEIILN